MSESILWYFAVSKMRVLTVKFCYKGKTSDGDKPANCYEPELYGNVSLIRTVGSVESRLPNKHKSTAPSLPVKS